MPGLSDYETKYYGENYARLQDIKETYDPDNLFNHPQGIKLPTSGPNPTPPPPDTPDPGTSASDGGISTAVIAGVASGGVVLLAGAGVGYYRWDYDRRRMKGLHPDHHQSLV